MTELGRIIVRFAGVSVAVEHERGTPARVVEFLFGAHQLATAVDEVSPHTTVSLAAAPDRPEFEIRHEARVFASARSAEALAGALLAKVCYHLVEPQDRGLVLHAAALSRAGRTYLVAGPSGAGKTTLAAFLGDHGFAYHGDEMVFISAAAAGVEAFRRPLRIKPSGIEVLADYLGLDRLRGRAMQAGPELLLAPSRAGAASPVVPPLAAVLFPSYVPGQACRVERLSPGRTALHLMECLINGRNLSAQGFAETAQLARSVPGFSLRYDDLHQVREALAAGRIGR